MADTSRRTQIEEMLAETPDDPFLRYGLAMEYVSSGEDKEAVRHFKELIESAPDYVPGYMQAGQAYSRLNLTEEAKEVWHRGSVVARQKGDHHAAEEMEGFIDDMN